MILTKLKYGLLVLGLSLLIPAKSQIIVRPFKKDVSNARIQGLHELDTLLLPFWDDFSTSLGNPDPALWSGGDVVTINSGREIQPPSLNAASFDGVNAFGNPYNPNPEETGRADTLVSQCIDLSVLGADQNDSVFFSFWYQLKGNVEQPDPEDSINLEFKDVDGDWQIMWSALGSDTGTKFDSVLIQVDPSYFHSCFQFRFQSFGNLSGPFDAWHIDYVYLNDGREPDDYGIPDRTLTRLPSKILDVYNSVPLSHFVRDSMTISTHSETQFFNHDNNQVTGFNFQAAVWTEHLGQQITLDSIRPNDAFTGQIPFPFNRRQLLADDPLDIFKVYDFLDTTDIDTLVLNTTFAISGTGDQPDFDGSINFLVNDTATSSATLSDYYAYDDGTPEFEFGVNGAGTQLAYMFVIEEQSELTDIDIAFTSGDLSEIVLRVWSSIENGNEVLLRQFTSMVDDQNGEFVRYTFPSIFVSDTFYIGYEQKVDGFVFMGLDKENETKDRIFFNGDGIWQQDTVNVSGSLLMRPVFGDSSLVTGIEDPLFVEFINVYPNPANHTLNVDGDFDELYLYDLLGRPVARIEERRRNGAVLRTDDLAEGVYILKAYKEGLSNTRKIIIKH